MTNGCFSIANMQIEGMADITPPLIDADPAKLPPVAA